MFKNGNRTEDLTPPVLSPTGNALSLGCNPTANVIDGALGTAQQLMAVVHQL
jgi:hypothetical protein